MQFSRASHALTLAPQVKASEGVEGGDFTFDVSIAPPVIGSLVHYKGRLRPIRPEPTPQ
ncbi:MAG: DUF4166 domain-containing protein [Pseudomonadota bacterium]